MKLLQGLKGDGSAPAPELAIVQPHVAYIVQFITVVAQVLYYDFLETESSDEDIGCFAPTYSMFRTLSTVTQAWQPVPVSLETFVLLLGEVSLSWMETIFLLFL